jgi:hypothetical protein
MVHKEYLESVKSIGGEELNIVVYITSKGPSGESIVLKIDTKTTADIMDGKKNITLK